MRIRDLMTKQVASVRSADSSAVAARLMWDCDCGAVPVIDDDGRAIAVVTDRDICMAALMRDRAPSAIPVAEAMSRDLKSCGPDDEVATAEEIMRTHQIRRLPIVDRDRRPVGHAVARRHRARHRSQEGPLVARGGARGGRGDARGHLRACRARGEPAAPPAF